MAQYTQINPDALVTALAPINNSLGGKQDKTDSTLATTDKTISGAINEINTKVGNLTGALTWKGKFDTLPAVTDYEAGNVVGVGNKEYVLTVTGSTKAWEELGDEGSYLLKSVAEETYAKKTSIPTVNDPKVSIKMNGAEKGSFTLNQVAAGEVDLGTVLTEHQDISGKVDKTTLLNTLMVVDLTSDDIAVRKAALDDFKAKWLALGNTDLVGARFIAKGYFNLPGPPENNVIMTYVENGLVATGYTGIAIASYNSIISSYRVNIALDGTMSFNAIRDSEITDEFRQFAWGEVPSTYLKITDAESTYETKTHAAETLTETLRDYVKSEEIPVMGNMATANAITSIKQDLSPVLKEIDLTGTDEERKAKLDQFEADWKELTGADTLEGARFVGYFGGPDNFIGIFTYNPLIGGYSAIATSDSLSTYQVFISPTGVIMSNSLFYHLQPITIRTDNTDSDMAANVAAIQKYINNLTFLGVYTYDGFTIPVSLTGNECCGYLICNKYHEGDRLVLSGTVFFEGIAKIIVIDETGRYEEIVEIAGTNPLNTTSDNMVDAINEVNTLAKNKQDTLTSGTNIKTINNQSILGSGNINITGGVTKCRINVNTLVAEPTGNEPLIFKMPLSDVQKYKNYDVVEIYSAENGVETTMYTVYHGAFSEFYATSNGTGWLTGMFIGDETTTDENKIGFVLITSETADTVDKDAKEPISSRAVYTALQGKQDTLTSGTNIKTINNQSLLGSGNIKISAPSITVDTTMSDTSTNPVQNKVIKAYIDGLVGNVEAQLAQL